MFGNPSSIYLLVIFGLIFLGLAFADDEADRRRYVSIIDAGSTGSRIYVYSFQSAAPLESLRAVGHQRLRPALSSFVNDTTGLTLQLQSLISTATQWIPVREHAHTRVCLMATAGLRRLPIEQQDILMRVVYDTLDASPFLHPSDPVGPGSSGVISGQEEATYDFLAVLAAFQPTLGSLNEGMLLGAADLGGSSTQFAFMCPPGTSDSSCGDVHLSLRSGLDHALAVHARSVPGLGLIEGMEGLMRRYERERLLVCTGEAAHAPACEALSRDATVWGPANPYDRMLPAWASARLDESNPCIPTDGVPLSTADGEHTVAGSGDFDSCVLLVRDYLFPRADGLLCHNSGETVDESGVLEKAVDSVGYHCNRHEPRPSFVIGLDNFPKVLEVLGLLPKPVPAAAKGAEVLAALALAPADIADAGRAACSQPWSQLLLALPADAPSYRAHRACYGAAFIYVLLTEVYGIPPEAAEFVPLEELDPFGELGWALGAALALAAGNAGWDDLR